MARWSRVVEATMRAHGTELLAEATVLAGPLVAAPLLEDALTAVFGGLRTPRDVEEAVAAVHAALRTLAVRRDDAPPPASSPPRRLELLAPRQRALLALRYRDGLSAAAIAQAVGLPEATVRTALGAAAAAVGLAADDAMHGGTDPYLSVTVGEAR